MTSRILRPDWWVWFGWFKENFLTVNMLKMRGPRGVVWEGVFGVYIVRGFFDSEHVKNWRSKGGSEGRGIWCVYCTNG